MVTAELNQRQPPHRRRRRGHRRDARRRPARASSIPRSQDRRPPHPTLTGSLGDWLGILPRTSASWPRRFCSGCSALDKSRLGRRAGDLVVVAVIAVNAIPVGIALGRWQGRLIPYVPQLPLEWAALIVAVSAWLTIRTTTATRQSGRRPGRRDRRAGARRRRARDLGDATPARTSRRPAARRSTRLTAGPCRVGARGLLSPRILRRDGRVAARSRAPFPSHRSVPLGRKPALTGLHQPPPDPHKEGPPHEHRHPHRPPHRRPRAAHHRQRTGRQPPRSPSSGPARTAKTRAPTTSTSPSSDARPRPAPSTSPRAARSPSRDACTTPNGTPTTAGARSSRSSPATSSSSTPARPTTTAPAPAPRKEPTPPPPSRRTKRSGGTPAPTSVPPTGHTLQSQRSNP